MGRSRTWSTRPWPSTRGPPFVPTEPMCTGRAKNGPSSMVPRFGCSAAGIAVEAVVGTGPPPEVPVPPVADESVPSLDGRPSVPPGRSPPLPARPSRVSWTGSHSGSGVAGPRRHHRVPRPVLPVEDHPARQVPGRVLVGVEREERLLHVVVVGRLVDEAMAEPVDHDRVGRGPFHADEPGQWPALVLLARAPRTPGTTTSRSCWPGRRRPPWPAAARHPRWPEGCGDGSTGRAGTWSAAVRSTRSPRRRARRPRPGSRSRRPSRSTTSPDTRSVTHGDLVGPGLEQRFDARGTGRPRAGRRSGPGRRPPGRRPPVAAPRRRRIAPGSRSAASRPSPPAG